MIVELLERLRRGDVTAADVVGELLHSAHTLTNAVMAFEDDRALADAAVLDRAFVTDGPVGPLHGLPVTVKDWIDVEGFPCAGETDGAISWAVMNFDSSDARNSTVSATSSGSCASRTASARPGPRAAPVISATLPSTRPVMPVTAVMCG